MHFRTAAGVDWVSDSHCAADYHYHHCAVSLCLQDEEKVMDFVVYT